MRRIYLLGIGGIAMANLAGLLSAKSGSASGGKKYVISGSDSGVFEPSKTVLEELGIKYFDSYQEQNIKKFNPDIVVIGNAISRGNKELEYVLESGFLYKSMPEVIREEFVRGNPSTGLRARKSIVVTGTSGKTTTAALVSWILYYNKMSPTFLVGGTIKNINSGFSYGKGDYVVLEGDEYNSSFYDACPKFLHYQPYIGIINNIELDHVDIFPTIEDIVRAFKRFIRLIPHSGLLILNKDNPNSAGLVPHAQSKTKTFGAGGDIEARNIVYDEKGIRFEIFSGKKKLGNIESSLLGNHNAENILAATLACLKAGVAFPKISEAVSKFEGVKRRLEVIYKDNKTTIIDDFAHNPEKVSASLSALRIHFPKSRLIAVFEPRTNSSRRKIFQSAYINSFKTADFVYIASPFRKESIPPRELFSHNQLADDLKKNGITAYALDSSDDIVAHIKNNLLKTTGSPAIFCIMSSGEFDGIHQKLIDLVS